MAARRRRILVAGLVGLVWAAAIATIVVATVRTDDLHSTPAALNDAVVSETASQAVLKQASEAMVELWSYDYRKLQDGPAAAARLGTPGFVSQYAGVFENIQSLAPQAQAVVTAQVAQAAVRSLHGDRATVIVFLNQKADKRATGQTATAGARLRVEMQRVDGSWKVSSVTPF